MSTSSDRWDHFNVSRLFDQAELDRAFSLCAPQPLQTTRMVHAAEAAVEANIPNVHPQIADVLSSPSSLRMLLSPGILNNNPSTKSASTNGSNAIFQSQIPPSTESCANTEQEAAFFDLNQLAGLLHFEPTDREALFEAIQDKVMSSCLPKHPSPLRKRITVIEKIHEALQLHKQIPTEKTPDIANPEKEQKSNAKSRAYELSPAVDLGMNAFLSIREKLDLTEPVLCKNLIKTLRPVFSEAFSSKLDISNDSPIISAVISFLNDAISNSNLEEDIRSQSVEILFQIYVGQASVSGILKIIKLLLTRNGTEYCNLNLFAPLQELANLVDISSNLGVAPELRSFGRGDTGRLGQGSANASIQIPQVIEGLRGKNILDVATFSTHSLAISDSGDVYAWGNGQHGRLGTKSLANAPTPIQIKPLVGHRVVAVAVGLSHSVLLSDQGRVFTFGNGVNGRLGTGDTKERRVPTMIQSLAQYSIIGIACGSAFTFALGEGGSLFSWGKNTTGQCGHGNLSECQTPRRISALANETIVHIAGGWDHALACSSRGIVYSWGCGYEGTRPVLGNGSKTRQHTPTALEKLYGHHVVRVAAGYDHSLAICDTGEVFAWGSSAVGQLGLGDTQERLFPERVQALSGQIIVSADGGMDHTLFITRDGDVYACGNGAENALGVVCAGPMKTPQLVDSLKGKYAKKVACGDKCSIVLSTSRLENNSAAANRPLRAPKVIRVPGIALKLSEKTQAVGWTQVIVHSLAVLDMSSASSSPNDNLLWDDHSSKSSKSFERFAIDLKSETFEHLAEILEIADSYRLSYSPSTTALSRLSSAEGRSDDCEDDFDADEIFIPFILISVLRVLKIHIWHAIKSNGTISLNADICRRLHLSIVSLMKKSDRLRPEWNTYIRQEASEIFVLGVELWYPKELYAGFLSEVINGNTIDQFPDQTAFGVSIQDALMKRLSEPSLLSKFLQSNHECGDQLVSTLLKLIRSVQDGSAKAGSHLSSQISASTDRKDSGTNPDVSFTWVRSPVNQIQKLTSQPAVASTFKQRGDIALLIAFQQALINQVFLERTQENGKFMSSPFPSHRFLTRYTFELVDHCCSIIDSSSGKEVLQESVIGCVLPVFITSLHCFSNNVYLGCALLDKLKILCQRVEHVLQQTTGSYNTNWLSDLAVSTIVLCGQFLSTLLESDEGILQTTDHSEICQFFGHYGPASKSSSAPMQICAMRYFVELLPLVSNFLTLDAILTCMLPKAVKLQADPNDWELASIMETFYHLLMGLPHRSQLTVIQQQAITVRVLPYLTSEFVVHSSKLHSELGILTFLRDCIWRIQYAQNSDNELSMILYEVHLLGVRALQSIMLQSGDIVQPALESLFQELSSAATWSLSTAALKPSCSDQQTPALLSSAIMLIGPSRCLSPDCFELPNLCQDPLTDFTLSAWLWTSESPALVLQFKGQPAFFSVSTDSVRGVLGTTEVRHESALEPNHWHLLTLTVKNRQLRLYIDDTLANQQTSVSAFPAFPTDVPLLLSGNIDNRICGLRWWNEALPAEEMTELYQEGPHRVSDHKDSAPFVKASALMANFHDSVPYEYLCMLNCMSSVWGIRNSLGSKWASVLATLLKNGTARMKMIILRTIGDLLQEKDLLEFEPTLWSMCSHLWLCNDDVGGRPEDDEICIRQESSRLYRRLLGFAAIRDLLVARLRLCVSECLKSGEISNNCICALSILGGSMSMITVGSYVCLSSATQGIITSLDSKTGVCCILVEAEKSKQNSNKCLKRFVLRQELLSKCQPIDELCNITWTPELLSIISSLVHKSIEKLEEMISSDAASSKNSIQWAIVANQGFGCIANLVCHSATLLESNIADALQASGIIHAVAKLASTPLPQSIQPKFRSINNLKGFVRSFLTREKPSESRANMIVGSGRRGIIPVQIVSSLESLGLIPLRSPPAQVVPIPDPNAPSYKCPGCSQHDLTMPTLLVHFQKHHSKAAIRSECPLCSASSRSIPGTIHASIGNHFKRCHKSLAANGSDLPVSTVSQDSVAKLMAMGFEVDHCIYALEQNNEDLVAATNWILNNLSTVGALVEAKKAAAAAAAAAASQAVAPEESIDENNSYDLARNKANEMAESSRDYFDLECGSHTPNFNPDFKSSAMSAIASNYFHTLLELAVMTARYCSILCIKHGIQIHLELEQYVTLLKLTVFRGQISPNDRDNTEVHLEYLKKLSAEAEAAVLVDEVLRQLNLAISEDTSCLYEEVAWGSRATECTDLQAVDGNRLCLERVSLLIQSGIVPQIMTQGPDLVVKALYNANVHVKMLAFKLLSDPSASSIELPIDRLCLLLSRCLIQDRIKKLKQHSPFTSALLQLCLARVRIPSGIRALTCDVAAPYDVLFDDMSPLKVSEDGLSAVHMMDGVWLSAVTKQPIVISHDEDVLSSTKGRISVAFSIDHMTNRMISLGIASDPNDVSCSWIGSSEGSWGVMADGSVWHAGQRIFNLNTCFEVNDVLGFIIDLRFGTVSLHRNGTELGHVFRNLQGTVYPCISLFYQNNNVSIKKGWQKPESSQYPQDLESVACSMLSDVSPNPSLIQ